MKWLNSYRMRLLLIAFVAVIVLGGGSVNADYTWMRKADMPTTTYQPSTSVVGGKIYAIGGWYRIGNLNPQWDALTRVDEYDPATDTWTRKAYMPTARGYTSTCVVNEKIYVIGGDVRNEPISIVEVYDPATDTWTRKADMTTRRFWFSASIVDGIIYVIGGSDADWSGMTHLGTVEAYDPTTDTWTPKASMPTGRSFSSTCVVEGKIYVIGGAMGAKAAVEAYDPTTNTWTVKAPMPTARYLLGTSLVGGKIYAIGGYHHSINGPIYSTVEVYDPATDTWTKGVDIPVPTAGLSTSVVDGKIYAIGGTLATHAGEHWVLTSAVYASDVIVDLNGDGTVDVQDIVILTEHWGSSYSLCDIGPTPLGDGIVDIQDLLVLAEYIEPEVREPGLVAHWKFDETEGGTAYDNVSGEDAFVIVDPVWQPTGGMVDGAIQLDGVDDCIITEPVLNPAEGPFSVFAWIKGGAPGQVIVSQERGMNWLMTDTSDGTLRTDLREPAMPGRNPRPPGPPLICTTVVTNGDWHRIGFVWDGSYRTLYVDDIAVVEDTQDSLEYSDGGLYIGTGSSMEPGTFWSGLIDDIRIYNRAVIP